MAMVEVGLVVAIAVVVAVGVVVMNSEMPVVAVVGWGKGWGGWLG
jgi:hypothetical protein